MFVYIMPTYIRAHNVTEQAYMKYVRVSALEFVICLGGGRIVGNIGFNMEPV